MPRWRHSCTSYFGSSSVKPTNSSEAESLKSLIGKTELNTAWRPRFSRFSASTDACRKRSKVCFCISIRFGICRIEGIFEQSLRMSSTFSEAMLAFTGSISASQEQGGGTCAPANLRARAAVPLLHVHLTAGRLDLLLDLLGLVLRHAFLHGLGGAFHEVL